MAVLEHSVGRLGHSILQSSINRYANEHDANVYLGLQLKSADDLSSILTSLRAADYQAVDLTDNEIAKVHVRHMLGGHAGKAANERLFRFRFRNVRGHYWISLMLWVIGGISACSIIVIMAQTLAVCCVAFKWIRMITVSLRIFSKRSGIITRKKRTTRHIQYFCRDSWHRLTSCCLGGQAQ